MSWRRILENASSSQQRKEKERGKSLFGIFDPKNLFDPKLRWRTRVAVGSLSDGRPPCSEICFFNFFCMIYGYRATNLIPKCEPTNIDTQIWRSRFYSHWDLCGPTGHWTQAVTIHMGFQQPFICLILGGRVQMFWV